MGLKGDMAIGLIDAGINEYSVWKVYVNFTTLLEIPRS